MRDEYMHRCAHVCGPRIAARSCTDTQRAGYCVPATGELCGDGKICRRRICAVLTNIDDGQCCVRRRRRRRSSRWYHRPCHRMGFLSIKVLQQVGSKTTIGAWCVRQGHALTCERHYPLCAGMGAQRKRLRIVIHDRSCAPCVRAGAVRG